MVHRLSYFFSFSSRCSFSTSRSLTDSMDSFRSPSVFRLVRSSSVRSFFSCCREISSCTGRGVLARAHSSQLCTNTVTTFYLPDYETRLEQTDRYANRQTGIITDKQV